MLISDRLDKYKDVVIIIRVSITITYSGSGYSQSNPPLVLIAPPVTYEEDAVVDEYTGDSGVIVGFGLTTTVGLENQMIFDFYIPTNSYLRSANVICLSSFFSFEILR